MNSTMLGVGILIFSVVVRAVEYGYRRPTSEANYVMSHLQNKMETPHSYGGSGDCGAKENRIIDGVYYPKTDPMTENLNNFKRKEQCIENKLRAQNELNKNVRTAIDTTMQKFKKDMQEGGEKKDCVVGLDRGSHECFVKNVLNDFYTNPVWKVVIHDNVSQMWYGNHLVLMMVYETVNYNVKKEESDCLTFFNGSNMTAEQNALGHLVKVVGKPPTIGGGSKGECRPCSDFINGKTSEGAGKKCSSKCDPSASLFDGSSFKVIRPSVSREVESKDKSKEND